MALTTGPCPASVTYSDLLTLRDGGRIIGDMGLAWDSKGKTDRTNSLGSINWEK